MKKKLSNGSPELFFLLLSLCFHISAFKKEKRIIKLNCFSSHLCHRIKKISEI